jgi:solute carrier family 44 (choline transporter-like protein), member 3
VKFFNNHAFTETALKGTNFCSSGASAMSVIVSNSLRFGIMHGLGSIVMIFAKLFITASVSITSYYVLKH